MSASTCAGEVLNARTGIREYVVVMMYERRVAWFALREGVYEPLAPDERGVLRSEAFPGLWLDPTSIWSGDLAGTLELVREGLASPEHQAFVEELRSQPAP